MAKSKKYGFLIEQDNNGWTAVITRRVTSRTTVVSKTQSDFASEAEAQAWAESEVANFLKKLNSNELEKRRAKKKLEEQKNTLKDKKEELSEKSSED